MSGWAQGGQGEPGHPSSAPRCHLDPVLPAPTLCLPGPFPSAAGVVPLPSWLLASMGPLPPFPGAFPPEVSACVCSGARQDSPRRGMVPGPPCVATIACPGENGAFLQPEAVAPMGQGTQAWPWKLLRRVTVTCPHLSFPQGLCWGPVPSALTVPAQVSAGVILQRGRAKPRGLNNVPAAGNSCRLCPPAPRETGSAARLPVHGGGGRAATGTLAGLLGTLRT